MTESLTLPLRLPTSKNRAHDSLGSRISQINSHKGFRNVTEASLLEEIKRQTHQDEDIEMVEAEESGAEEPEDRYQMIIKSREDMIQQLRRAQNDTLMALDFISFLLSKFAPTTAQSTMSPTLKDAVPIGTLEARILKYTPPSASESKSTELVARAYKLKAFSDSAEKLLGAATRLEDEAAKETTYWDQILSVKQKGWSISKVPRDPRTLGVHFGFRDAAPSFRNRGFAALRRNADGTLRLDQGAVPSTPVAVQVSIVRDGQNCGTSSMPYSSPSTEEKTIDEQILQARNTLYEEELFHELGREARLLANQGASVSSKRIKMPLDEKTIMQIDLVSPDDNTPSNDSEPDRLLADGIAVALRILLSHAHEENLRRRCQPPPPMTLKPRSIPEYGLIRPIITHLQHRRHLNSLTTFLSTIIQPISSAGLQISLKTSSISDSLLNSSSFPSANLNPTSLLTPLTNHPATSTISLSLPSSSPSSSSNTHDDDDHKPSSSFTIIIHTSLLPPHHGTDYTLYPTSLTYPHLSPSSLVTPSKPFTLTRLSDLQSLIRQLLTVEVVAHIARPSSLQDKERTAWVALDPHAGLLARAHGKQKRAQVKVWDDRLGLRSEEGRAWVWNAKGMETVAIGAKGAERRRVERRDLVDVVRELS